MYSALLPYPVIAAANPHRLSEKMEELDDPSVDLFPLVC